MAPTGKAVQRFGWENQSERLTATHMAAGLAALTVAGEARGRMLLRATTSRPHSDDPAAKIVQNDHAHEFTLASVRDLQTQLARQNLATREMRERIDSLAARATEADKCYAELQDELNVAREEILFQQNDKYSLQASSDALAKEKAHLVHRLADCEAAVKKVHSQIEQAKKALNAAQLARKDLTAALQEARQKHQIESDALRAAKQERTKLVAALDRMQQKYRSEVDNLKSLEGERDKLVAALESTHRNYQIAINKVNVLEAERIKLAAAHSETNERNQAEISRLKSCLDDTTTRADVAEDILAKLRQILLEKFKLLQASVGAKDYEIHELEQSRMKLVDSTKMLLGIFEMRDIALTRADARIKFLTDRIAELEAELYPAKSWQRLKELDDQAESESLGHERRDASHRVDTNILLLNPALNTDFGDDLNHSESARVGLSKAMLTATIAF